MPQDIQKVLKRSGFLVPYVNLTMALKQEFVDNLIRYAYTIDGFLVNYQVPFLFTIFSSLRGKGVEVGAYYGRTTSVIMAANPALDLVVIDPFTGSEEHQEDMKKKGITSYYLDFLENMRMRDIKVSVVQNYSVPASKDFADNSLDFVWIDGAHDYENVKNDIAVWTPKLKSGGIILGHDMPDEDDKNGGFEELVKAVNEGVKNSPLYTRYGYFCGIWGAVKK